MLILIQRVLPYDIDKTKMKQSRTSLLPQMYMCRCVYSYFCKKLLLPPPKSFINDNYKIFPETLFNFMEPAFQLQVIKEYLRAVPLCHAETMVRTKRRKTKKIFFYLAWHRVQAVSSAASFGLNISRNIPNI